MSSKCSGNFGVGESRGGGGLLNDSVSGAMLRESSPNKELGMWTILHEDDSPHAVEEDRSYVKLQYTRPWRAADEVEAGKNKCLLGEAHPQRPFSIAEPKAIFRSGAPIALLWLSENKSVQEAYRKQPSAWRSAS